MAITGSNPTQQLLEQEIAKIKNRRNTHTVKAFPETFSSLWNFRRTSDVRRNDRDYQAGDTVKFVEANRPNPSDGMAEPIAEQRWVYATVTAVYADIPGLRPGYVLLILKIEANEDNIPF